MGSMIGRSVVALAACLAALGAAAAPAVAQGPAASAPPAGVMCLVTIDELNELTGLRFVRTATGPWNCTYDGDPAEALVTLDLRLVPPDETVSAPVEDGLLIVRTQYPDGRDLTIAGYPAWESRDGVWVDVGEGVFVAQPILFFMADPPDATAFLVPLVELALSRLPAGLAA